jgi:hypothetical protein
LITLLSQAVAVAVMVVLVVAVQAVCDAQSRLLVVVVL